jgi:transcriptional antiterminator NusG
MTGTCVRETAKSRVLDTVAKIMSAVMSEDWHIFRTRPQREREAGEQLGRLGIAAMAPRTREFQRLSRSRLRAFDQPVYRGYVFASVEGKQWLRLHEAPSVSPKPLAADGKAYRMRSSEVAEVEELVRNPPKDPRDTSREPRGANHFKVGDKVRVLQGAFAGFSGVVEEVRKQVRIATSIFGRPTPTWVDETGLEFV